MLNNSANNDYELEQTGRLSPKMNPVKRGKAAAFCRTEGGPSARINSILASPHVGNTTKQEKWKQVKEVAIDECNRLNRYTKGENVDVDVGYLLDVEQRIRNWKKNAASQKYGGKRLKTRRQQRKRKGTRRH